MNRQYYFLAVVCMAIANFTHSYNVTAINETDGNLKMDIIRARADVCSPLTALVERGATRVVDCGVCCIKEIRFLKYTGSNAGIENRSNPPTTGSGMRCASITVTIRDAGPTIVESYKW